MAYNAFADLQNLTKLGQSILSSTATTTTSNGSSFDAQLTDGPIHALVDVSAVSGTGTPTATVQLQESADGSTNWTNIATNSQAGTTSVTAVGASIISSNERIKRYVRAQVTTSGNTPSFTMSVDIIGFKKIAGSGAGTTLLSTPGAGF